MMKVVNVALFLVWLMPGMLFGQAAINERNFFTGGKSDISGADAKRAVKAIAKWSDANGKQGDRLLSSAPFYWDASQVGKPVFIRIIKNSNRGGRLEVWVENASTKRYEHYKTYGVHYFSGKLGPKTKEGDLQAPEGFYFISRSRMNPVSSYHLSMDMGYPNAYDQKKGYTGKYLMIHGSTPSLGCFAMTDCSIEQIYTLVDQALTKGQKIVRVHSFPFPMTETNMLKYTESEHYPFWINLKEGWDWFEKNRRPPNVEVKNEKYVFSEIK